MRSRSSRAAAIRFFCSSHTYPEALRKSASCSARLFRRRLNSLIAASDCSRALAARSAVCACSRSK